MSLMKFYFYFVLESLIYSNMKKNGKKLLFLVTVPTPPFTGDLHLPHQILKICLINICNFCCKTLVNFHVLELYCRSDFSVGVKDAYFHGCANFLKALDVLQLNKGCLCLSNPDCDVFLPINHASLV